MNEYTYDNSESATYLNDILKSTDRYIRERVSNKIRKHFELINNAKDSPLEVRHIVHKYILEQTKIGTKGATPLQNSLYRNVVITKSKVTLKI